MLISELLDEAKNKHKKISGSLPLVRPNNYTIQFFISSALIKDTQNDPDMQAGVKTFVANKISKIRDLESQKQLITPKSLNIPKDRGTLYAIDSKYQHCHLPLPPGDPRVKDLAIFYWQQIDRENKRIMIYLGRVVGHDVYLKPAKLPSLGASLDNTKYQPLPVAESRRA